MAERRMFSKKIVGSARFLRLPAIARLLYYDLGMQADDDGVVEAFTVLQMTHADESDLNALVEKGFIRILNEDLVALVIDWKTNNLIKKDRYRPSFYSDLLSGTQAEPQDRIGKDRLDQYSIGKARGKEPEPFDPNEFDSIREEFIERFEREPDGPFMPSVKTQMAAGKSEQDVIEVIRQAAQRHPHGAEDFEQDACKIVFNRDVPVSTSETIQNYQNSVGLLSDETILANHPFVTDVRAEMERIRREQQQMSGDTWGVEDGS